MKLPVLFRKWMDKWIYESDPIEAQKAMVSYIQRITGIHNVCGDKENETFTFLSLLSILIFGGTFIYVGSFSQLVYLAQMFPDKIESFKVLNCLSATSVPLSKYIFMWTARSRLRVIFEMSSEGLASIPNDSSAHTRMTKTLNTARYVRWLVVFNQASIHIMYLLGPLLFTVLGNDRYLPTIPGDCYGLSPKYETPYFEITFIVMVTATIFSAVNQTGYIVLFVTLLAHEVGHFYSITETLNDICEILKTSDQKKEHENIESQKSVHEKLKFCIKHHQFLLKYHQKIQELYKNIFGAHFLIATIVLVTTLQTMNEWDIRNTILTAATGILPLFIYCFGGELLITAGGHMSTAVYSCGWEFMEVKQARSVLLMLCLSQRPLCLTAANIFVMNRETFGDVAQVVYKIYAVFN